MNLKGNPKSACTEFPDTQEMPKATEKITFTQEGHFETFNDETVKDGLLMRPGYLYSLEGILLENYGQSYTYYKTAEERYYLETTSGDGYLILHNYFNDGQQIWDASDLVFLASPGYMPSLLAAVHLRHDKETGNVQEVLYRSSMDPKNDFMVTYSYPDFDEKGNWTTCLETRQDSSGKPQKRKIQRTLEYWENCS